MADIAIGASGVLKASDGKVKNGTAGGVLSAGLAVFEDSADDNKLKIADADVDATKAAVAGITLNGAAANQPVQFLTEGGIDLGVALTVGTILVL